MNDEKQGVFAEWAILELMGHRRLAGRVQEVAVCGQGLLRIDIPCEPPVTQYYGIGSVYCVTPTTEELARAIARNWRPEPVHPYELPPPAPVQRDFVRPDFNPYFVDEDEDEEEEP
jgi:hypothetical protein